MYESPNCCGFWRLLYAFSEFRSFKIETTQSFKMNILFKPVLTHLAAFRSKELKIQLNMTFK